MRPGVRKIALITVLAVVALAGLVGMRYRAWAVDSESPFDEVGIGLHAYMPGPVQAWGCGQLQKRFDGKTLPPHGCQTLADPRKWRSW